jgi:hypothetical protein
MHHRQDTADWAKSAIQTQLAEEDDLFERRGRQLAGTHKERDGNGQVKARTAFGQAGREQVDRDPAVRPRLAGVHDRGADSVAGLDKRRVGQSGNYEPRQSIREVSLDLHEVPDQAD